LSIFIEKEEAQWQKQAAMNIHYTLRRLSRNLGLSARV